MNAHRNYSTYENHLFTIIEDNPNDNNNVKVNRFGDL